MIQTLILESFGVEHAYMAGAFMFFYHQIWVSWRLKIVITRLFRAATQFLLK